MNFQVEKYIPEFMDCMYSEKINDVVRRDELIDMFHTNQIISKHEVIKACHKLKLENPSVLYVGSWMGYLTHILCNDFNYNVYELEFDKRCKDVSYRFNSKFDNYKEHYYGDVNTLISDFFNDFSLIINLSTEHMHDHWFRKIKKGTKVIIQSNNFDTLQDHINCVYSLDELKNKFPLSKICYESTIKCTIYERYTLVGVI